MKTMSIGEAARALEIEVDTLRRLERNGEIRASKTPGGHRRFSPAEIARFRNRRMEARAMPQHGKQKAAPRRTMVPSQYVTERTQEEDWELSDSWELESPIPPMASQRSPAPVANDVHDDRRLTSIKDLAALAIPFDLPAGWRARVLADLETFVTPHRFPPRLSQFHAIELVKDRIGEIIAPYREQEAREEAARQEKAQASRRLLALKLHGTMYAIQETNDWDWEPRTQARQEVDREVAAKTKADWSERDVERLVDDVLADWEDDENDDAEYDEE